MVETTYVCAHDYFFMFNIFLDPSSCFFSLSCCLILKMLSSVLFIFICPIAFHLFSVLKYPFVLTGLCWLDNSGSFFFFVHSNVLYSVSVDQWFQPLYSRSWLLGQPLSEWGTVIPGVGGVGPPQGCTGRGSLKGISFRSSRFRVSGVCWLPFLTWPLSVPLFSLHGERQASRLPFPNLMKIGCCRIQ